VIRPRAVDDFAVIRTRIEELRRERECAQLRVGPAHSATVGPRGSATRNRPARGQAQSPAHNSPGLVPAIARSSYHCLCARAAKIAYRAACAAIYLNQ
jgi:hypothetical protein